MSNPAALDTPNLSQKLHNWQGAFAIGFLLGFPFIYLYCFALIEAKYSVFLQLQPFRTGLPMTVTEAVLFIVLFSLELFSLLLGISSSS